MPKINVYLPEDLALAVREAGVPVSPVCQTALREAVRSIGRAHRAITALRDEGLALAHLSTLLRALESRMTAALREALRLATVAASPGSLESVHLLVGLLCQGDNLAIAILDSLELDTGALLEEAIRASAREPDSKAPTKDLGVRSGEETRIEHDGAAMGLGARRVLAAALEQVVQLGHNYLGCEHVLLGLLATEDDAAEVLRAAGLDEEPALRAVRSALVGFARARSSEAGGPVPIEEIVRRIEVLERRVGTDAS